jgi:Ca2+-binding EF-hand superfamily protein
MALLGEVTADHEPVKADMTAEDYWNMFVKDEKKGMTYREFQKAAEYSGESFTDDQIKAAYDIADTNNNNNLSKSEFMTLLGEVA